MKKSALFTLAIILTGLMSCSSSNGDRSKIGKPDTVGTKTNTNNPTTRSTQSSMDTLKK